MERVAIRERHGRVEGKEEYGIGEKRGERRNELKELALVIEG
jgi:hypothetical protein